MGSSDDISIRQLLALSSALLLSALQGGSPTTPDGVIFDFKSRHGFEALRRPEGSVPTSQVRWVDVSTGGWVHDPEVSWYGPGFYGKRTACGLAYTKQILGVAHRSLPCGTLVEFRWKGRTATVPVIDRGPYVPGRTWDLSGGLCVTLNHCFTGPIEYRILGG